MCAGNEAFFVALYLAKWLQTPVVASLPYLGAVSWPELAALICLPIAAVKNGINMVQLWKASKMLVGVDIAERQAAREKAMEVQAQQGRGEKAEAS
jgi:CDP-diacylglycerol--inositol 3-phosphatidyltransferase